MADQVIMTFLSSFTINFNNQTNNEIVIKNTMTTSKYNKMSNNCKVADPKDTPPGSQYQGDLGSPWNNRYCL